MDDLQDAHNVTPSINGKNLPPSPQWIKNSTLTFTLHNMVTKKRGIFSLFTPCILIAIIIVIIVETRRLIAVEPIWNLIEIVPRGGVKNFNT